MTVHTSCIGRGAVRKGKRRDSTHRKRSCAEREDVTAPEGIDHTRTTPPLEPVASFVPVACVNTTACNYLVEERGCSRHAPEPPAPPPCKPIGAHTQKKSQAKQSKAKQSNNNIAQPEFGDWIGYVKARKWPRTSQSRAVTHTSPGEPSEACSNTALVAEIAEPD